MKTKQTKEDFEFKMMMREDNFEVLTKCTPKASHRMMEIISEGYNDDFDNDEELDKWFRNVEQAEQRRFPTRWRLQVVGSLNHIKMLLKSHYKFRFDTYAKYNK